MPSRSCQFEVLESRVLLSDVGGSAGLLAPAEAPHEASGLAEQAESIQLAEASTGSLGQAIDSMFEGMSLSALELADLDFAPTHLERQHDEHEGAAETETSPTAVVQEAGDTAELLKALEAGNAALAAANACDPELPTNSPARPLLLVPGIGGTFVTEAAKNEWYVKRGIEPSKLQIDPLSGVYYDLIKTLDNVGYTPDRDLFVVNYDWRMNPGPQDASFNGKIDGLTAAGITDTTYAYGVDYLGHFLKQAAEAWRADHGAYPDTVDVIAHSTGGLVTRVYLQSDAYGQTASGVPLPRVNDFIMMGVPNRGASKAWNVLHDQWSIENAFRVVLSKMLSVSYERYKNGEIIRGADGDINPATGILSHVEFINKYAPTIRGLLATYDFLDTGVKDGQGQVDFQNVNSTATDRNWLALDLNDGLDLDYTIDQLSAANTYQAAGSSVVRKPAGFVEKLLGELYVMYGSQHETPVQAIKKTGPQGALDELLTFENFIGRPPNAGEVWYLDQKIENGGDGTVPLQSSRDMFTRLAGAKVIMVELPKEFLGTSEQKLDHTGLMWGVPAQKQVLDKLGLTYDEAQISQNLAINEVGGLEAAIRLGVLDPEEILRSIELDSIIREVLTQGLNRLSIFGNDAAGLPLLTQKLPLVDKSLEDLLGLKNLLSTVSHTIAGKISQEVPLTTDDIVNFFKGLPDPPAGLGLDLTVNPGLTYAGAGIGNLLGVEAKGAWTREDVLFSIGLEAKKEQIIPLAFSANADQYGFKFGVDAEVTVEGHATFTLVFGVDKRPDIALDERFFLRVADLRVGASLKVDDFDAEMGIGFLGAGITNGKLALGAEVLLALRDPNKNNRITLKELIETPLVGPGTHLLDFGIDARLNVNLPITTTFGDLSVGANQPSICINDLNALDLTLPTITLNGDFSKLLNFKTLDTDILLAALNELPKFLRGLDQDFLKGLPLVGPRINELLQFADYIPQIVQKIRASGEVTTAQAFKAAFEVALAQLDLPEFLTVNVTSTDIFFAFKIRKEFLNEDVKFALNHAIGEAINLNLEGQIVLNGAVEAGIKFGLSFQGGVELADRFYIVPGTATQVQASLRVTTPTPIAADATLGFLTVGVKNGIVQVAGRKQVAGQANVFEIDPTKPATITLALKDPDNNGKITLTELVTLLGDVLSLPTCDGAARASLELAPIDGITSPNPNPVPKVTLDWRDLCDLSTLSVTQQGLQEFLDAALDFSPDALVDKLHALVGIIDEWLGLGFLDTKVPFVDLTFRDLVDGFATVLKTYFQKIESGADTGEMLNELIDAAVQATLDELGLDPQTISLTPTGGAQWHDPIGGKFRYILRINFTEGKTWPFKLGGDVLSLNSSLTASAGATIALGFGFSAKEGVYLFDTGAAEIQVGATVDAKITAQGNFGPLKFGVLNGEAKLNAGIMLDLKDPDNSGIIDFSEIGDALTFDFGGTATINLPLGMRLGDGGPGVLTSFRARWNSDTPGEIYFTGKDANSTSTDPIDAFSPIQFELGEFFSKIIGPVLQQIKDANPLPMDIISKLYEPLPMIGKSPMDILNALAENMEVPGYVKTITRVLDHPAVRLLVHVATFIESLPDNSTTITVDLSQYLQNEPKPANPSTAPSESGGSTFGAFRAFYERLRDEFGVRIPIIESPGSTIVKILLRQDVDLISWKPPGLELSYTFDIPPIPILSYGVPELAGVSLNLVIGGGFRFFANVEVGLSTRGIFAENDDNAVVKLLNGFWIGDNLKGGDDQFEIGVSFDIYGLISGRATVMGIDLVELYGGLGIRGTIGLDVADVKLSNAPEAITDVDGKRKIRVGRQEDGGDGRIYLNELAFLLTNYGFLCTLTPGGTIAPLLKLGARGGCVPGLGCLVDLSWETELPPIFEFDWPCSPGPKPNLADFNNGVLEMLPSTSAMDAHVQAVLTRDVDGNVSGLRIMRISKMKYEMEEFSFVDRSGPKMEENGAIGGYIGGGTVHTLVLKGTNGKNKITIDPTVTYYPALFPLTTLKILAGAGDDEIVFNDFSKPSTLTSTELNGEGGNDTINGTKFRDVILGGDGDDMIASFQGDDEIRGGSGADFASAGPGADRLFGDAGIDTLYGNEGDDTINGGDDRDFLHGNAGRDTISGDGGNDIIGGDSFGIRKTSAGAMISLESTDLAVGDVDTINGGAGSDVIIGGRLGDTIAADDDSDYVIGDAGVVAFSGGAVTRIESRELEFNDTIDGGSGVDYIIASGGDDQVRGGSEADYVIGDFGVIRISGGTVTMELAEFELGGADTIYGDAGDDVLLGGPMSDTLHGGSGDDGALFQDNDHLAGDFATATIGSNGWQIASVETARGAADRIFGNGGRDFIVGGADADTLDGGPGGDYIAGDSMGYSVAAGASDTLTIKAMAKDHFGADTIKGGFGNDWIMGQSGADTIWGGNGTGSATGSDDDVIFGDSADITVGALSGGTSVDLVTGADDVIHGESGIDLIAGGFGNDRINGGAGDDRIAGDVARAGVGAARTLERLITSPASRNRDYIHGDGGNDTIYGQEDEDELFGDEGNDEIFGDEAPDRIWAGAGDDTVFGVQGNDVIRGETGNDTLSGGAGQDVIYGNEDPDTISGDEGGDRIYAGAGSDRVYGHADGAAGDDAAADFILGEEGDDVLFGNAGDDDLDGGAGVDELRGGSGNDLLNAGPGIGDRLYGEDGDDRIFGSDEGAETDSDFEAAPAAGDYLSGGNGADWIWGLGGADLIYGDAGDDRIDSGIGSDRVDGGADDDWIFAGRGLGDLIFGGTGDDTIYGSHEGNDTINGGEGNDSIWGQGGTDILHGNTGQDYLNGGAGADQIYGDEDEDELDGGGGAGDQLFGGGDDDVLLGSDDGADVLNGEGGDDSIFGRGGNDTINGGDGSDTLRGGAGDDTISGGNGPDLALGEGGHDVIHGNAAGVAGAADEVDYLFGDFGTNGAEAGFGGDQIFGGAGNDLLFGENGDDRIDPGPGNDAVDYGLGEGADPSGYPTPARTPDPSLVPATNLIAADASLPAGITDAGRWAEFFGSASGSGASGDPALSFEADLVVAAAGAVYLAWVDARNGNYEIYVARFGAGGWQQLGGSASAGGASSTAASSRRPAIALDAAGSPVVVWTETRGGASNILGARWNGTAWSALGDSLSANGISASGAADQAQLVNSPRGLGVAWLDASNGQSNVRYKEFNGTAWVEVDGSATGGGVTRQTAGNIADFSLASGTTVGIAWSTRGATSSVDMRELRNSVWTDLDAAPSVSNLPRRNFAPTLAYLGGAAFVAWQHETADGLSEIYAARNSGNAWAAIGEAGVSGTGGWAAQPKLAANGGKLYLGWIDDRIQNRTAEQLAIYVRGWNGTGFAEEVASDAGERGITLTGNLATGLEIAVDPSGKAHAAWVERTGRAAEVYLRGNIHNSGGRVLVAEGGTTVQSLLDANDLGPGDTILVRGSHSGAVNVAGDDAGVLIFGAPGATIAGNVTIGANDAVLQRVTVNGTVRVSAAARVTLRENVVTTLAIEGGAEHRAAHNIVANGLSVSGGATGARVEWNAVTGALALNRALQVYVRGNTVRGAASGITVEGDSSGTIVANDAMAGAAGIALNLRAAFDGLIERNEFHGAGTGVHYSAGYQLSANRIYGNATGVAALVNSSTDGFGFKGDTLPNEIYGNGVGVQLTGRMQGQHVFKNQTGVAGSGILGPLEAFDEANLIERNDVGVRFSGVVQFNRIGRNTTGIAAESNLEVLHNLIYRNRDHGLLVSGKDRVQAFHNTFYSQTGSNVHLQSGAKRVEIINNILWIESGYDIYVSNDSREGYFSDYNDLHGGDAGKLVFWALDFRDILDWQADVARFDLHSTGRTVVNPNWSLPRFASVPRDDYRVFELSAARKFSSPTIDSGAAFADKGLLLAEYRNLLANVGFDSGLTGWSTNPEAVVQAGNPVAYQGGGYFFAGKKAVGWAEQTVNLLAAGFTAAQLDSADLVAVFGGRIRAAAENVKDRGSISLAFYNTSGAALGEAVLLQARNAADRWELVGDRVHVPVGARTAKFRFEAVRQDTDSSYELWEQNNSYFDASFLYLFGDSLAPDLGAYGNTAAEAAQPAVPHVAIRTPELYVDWEKNLPHTILWDSFNNTAESLVRIELLQDGPGGPAVYRTLSEGAQDSGRFTWIPANFNVDFATHKLRVQITLSNKAVSDRGTEVFSVPENTATFFANDRDLAGDEHTLAAGNNRATGKLETAPKPYLNNLLRTYEIGATHHVYVDTGTYLIHDTVLISNTVGLGDDEGFAATGPSGAVTAALHRFANPLDKLPMFELNNADFVTLSRLSAENGGLGLWLRSGSENFTGDYLSFSGMGANGVQIDLGAAALLLDHVVSKMNGESGIVVNGTLQRLANSTVSENKDYGIDFDQQIPGVIENTIVFGNMDHGIIAGGLVAVRNNTVYAHQSLSTYGIYLRGRASATGNVVHTGRTGIYAGSSGPEGSVAGNRVYNMAEDGIYISGGAAVLENIVYQADVGLMIVYSDAPVRNNLVYGNTTAGIQIQGSRNEVLTVQNNTVYQPIGEGIWLDRTEDVTLRNNIVWVQRGAAIKVDADSQTGFSSDYNLLHATGTGSIGNWQGVARSSLAEWQNSAFSDQNSLAADPRFVSALGTDGVLGYASAAQDGRDDDFHLMSRFGSYRGGALAPALDAATGLPAALPGAFQNDATDSPAIDRADPAISPLRETAPNGGFANLGAYGATPQASRSPAQFVLVLRPDSGEVLPIGREFAIRWRGDVMTGAVTIDLRRNGQVAYTIAASTENDGEFLWTPTASFAPGEYNLRVTRGAIFDESNRPVTISAPITVYYVNDSTVEAGDWTTAPGNDANNGLTAAAPKASIRALLEAYSLRDGDVIRVDAGNYTVGSNIVVTANDSGVTIEGYSNPAAPARRALLDRANINDGSYVFELAGADRVTLRNLHMTGARYGIYASATADSDNLSIVGCTIYHHYYGGISIQAGNEGTVIANNKIYGKEGVPGASHLELGIELEAAGGEISGNEIYNHGYQGIVATAPGATISGNTIYNNYQGISATLRGDNPVAPITIRDNVVRANRYDGLVLAGEWVAAVGNTVHSHMGSGYAGIDVSGGARAEDNDVYGNRTGISAGGSQRTEVLGNRVHGNIGAGIEIIGTVLARGNRVYSNGVGLDLTGYSDAEILNNVIYANTAGAITLRGQGFVSGTTEIIAAIRNNTMHHAGGAVVSVRGEIERVSLGNNIFWAEGGVALLVDAINEAGFSSDYNLFHLVSGAKAGRWRTVEFAQALDWYFELGFDGHSRAADPRFADADGVDNILGGTGGADDNFHLQSGSPGIDAGDPFSYYLEEPSPNGGRADVGAYGNTREATASAAQSVQILSPNGFEKFELGQSVLVQWLAAGLGAVRPVAFINAGGPTVGNWLYSSHIENGFSSTISSSIDLSRVQRPANPEVYATYRVAENGAGETLRIHLPVPDGAYSVTLHFVEPSLSGANQRAFSISVNGTVAVARYDIASKTGGARRAIAETVTGSAVQGAGLAVELKNLTSAPAVLSAIEVTAPNASPTPAPSATLDLSTDNGGTWRAVADFLPIDRYGRGQFVWTAAGETSGNAALFRVSLDEGTMPSDRSDSAFLIANSGAHYYVNDGAFAAGDWTSAPGSSANSGKDAAHPLPSLAAVLRAYNVGAGDTIHIDAGSYTVLQNVALGAAQSGLIIEGADSGGRTTVLDRANPDTGSYLFQISGATGVVLRGLELAGAHTGIQVTGRTTSGLLFENLTVRNQAHTGILVEEGIGHAIRDSRVYSNAEVGLNLTADVRVSGTELHSQKIGAILSDGAVFAGGIVRLNGTGIRGNGDFEVSGSRVFGNTAVGIQVASGSSYLGGVHIFGNRVYGNVRGLALSSTVPGMVRNNLVYLNSESGIYISNGDYSRMRFVQNTFYQTAGRAFHVENWAAAVNVRNSIFVVSGSATGFSVTFDAQHKFESDYNLFRVSNGGKVGTWDGAAFNSVLSWRFALGLDWHSLEADPSFVDPDGADNLMGYGGSPARDGGADDDFHLAAGSPAIDAGDPASYYLEEPSANGGRANLGAYGNTREAAASAPVLVQILSPNGFDKFEAAEGQSVTWRVFGAGTSHFAALIDVGGQGLGDWLYDRYALGDYGQGRSSNEVDRRYVTDPAPEAVYQTFALAESGAGKSLAYFLPAPDGEYTVTLHFIEPHSSQLNERVFDIKLQGAVAAANYDVIAVAGQSSRAVERSLDAVAQNGAGLTIELVNKKGTPAILSAIEVARKPAGAVPGALVNLHVSYDNGGTWSQIAANLPANRLGFGQHVWAPPTQTNGNTALLRAELAGTNISDRSDSPFLIANASRHFYINGSTVSAGQWTTAAGDDLASGKDPARPMASLAGLLSSYNLDTGDIVHMDAGAYRILRDIFVRVDDSGATIEGYYDEAAPTVRTVLNRQNRFDESNIFELIEVDRLTLRRLSLTGAYDAVLAERDADVDDLAVVLSEVYGNQRGGIVVEPGNSRTSVLDSRIYGLRTASQIDQDYGVWLESDHAIVARNEIFDSAGIGAYVRSGGARIEGNTIYGNSRGLEAVNYNAGDPILVQGNRVRDNTSIGLIATGEVRVTGNLVYNQNGSEAFGMNISSGAWVQDNEVYLNWHGMIVYDNSRIANNVIYANVKNGLMLDEQALAERNRIYSNGVGILARGVFTGKIFSNLLYSNTEQGILFDGYSDDGSEIVNNTIVQPVGEALRISESGALLTLTNNIFHVGAGYAIYLEAGKNLDLSSNSNLFFNSADPNSRVGFWNGANQKSLAEWRAASQGDAVSLAADPLFVDVDGADNILGYRAGEGGRNGGADDNFQLGKGSAAIDRGDPWTAASSDGIGAARADDPASANLGLPDYVARVLGSSGFARTGAAKNWRSTGSYWELALPFEFRFYGKTYTEVLVTSSGFLSFSTSDLYDRSPTVEEFAEYPRIAPLWAEIGTGATNDNIFVDETVAGQVTIRWDATREDDGSDVNFSVTLTSAGTIRFHYGPGNSNLAPVIGISSGNGRAYWVSSYSAAASLANANSIEIAVTPGSGIVDLGAFEFRGSSGDTTSPTLAASNPPAVHSAGLLVGQFSEISLVFSEEINSVDANAAANYEVRSDGVNGVFGDADDDVYLVRPSYVAGSKTVKLLFSQPLPSDRYRLTVYGNRSVHDLAGLQFDGDTNGAPGGDYTRTFTVDAAAPVVIGSVINENERQRSRVDTVDIAFNTAVQASVQAADFSLKNLNTGQILGPGAFSVEFLSASEARLRMSVAMLVAAEYELTVLAAGIQNSNGTRMQENYVIGFHVAPGDLNGDQIANDLDLFRLWQVLLRPPSERSLEYDLNGDGQVNAGDLNLLKAHYLDGATAGLSPQSKAAQEPRAGTNEPMASMAPPVLAPWLKLEPGWIDAKETKKPVTLGRGEARL